MSKKIKCPGLFCGSTDVDYLGGNQSTSINLNPLKPFTLTNTNIKKGKKPQGLTPRGLNFIPF